MGKTATLRILMLLRVRLADEAQQYKRQPEDRELRGRYLATKGILEEVFAILER